jgi:glycosyltransferase involved in cell wall biosynthesis
MEVARDSLEGSRVRTRVLQLVLSLSPGGTERLVIEICRRLADRVDSSVICLDEPGAWAHELEAAGVDVLALGRRPGFQPSLARQIARVIKARRIEVIHAHHYSPYVYAALAALLAPVRVVFTEHGRVSDAAPSWKRRVVNPLLARLPARICAVSADLRRHMIAEGFPAHRIGVVYNGIEAGRRPGAFEREAARAALGLPRQAFVIGTVGRLDPVKNLHVLLRAHAIVTATHPWAQLIVIGDGPERAALEAKAAALRITGSVRFVGYRRDVRLLVPAFDVFANTSDYEGVSLTILEAMAAAVPVVAAPVGGNPEVVAHQETGLLSSAAPALFAAALCRLAADGPGRRALGEAGRRRVETRFSIDRMIAAYADAYLARPSAKGAAPAMAPTPADTTSVSEATRSTV